MRISFWSLAALVLLIIGTSAHAQTRKPTAKEIAAVRDCATRSKEDVDAGEQQCLFKLVADPCIGTPGSVPDAVTADCYRIEGEIGTLCSMRTTKACSTD